MRIKTFEGKTEQEALEKAREELGVNAVVMSIRRTNKKSVLPFMKNNKVEITAAVENGQEIIQTPKIDNKLESGVTKNLAEELQIKENLIKEQERAIEKLTEKVQKSDELIGTLTRDIIESSMERNNIKNEYDNEVLYEVFERLVSQDVMEPVAHYLLESLNGLGKDELNYNNVMKVVYSKIIDIIGEISVINTNIYAKDRIKTVFFMGPTGVGKTTTIAKLSSKFILEDHLNVGLITADTYRIAAVDQLKTYADILGADIKVAYDKTDMIDAHNSMVKSKDLIIVDTAGRSHKNVENVNDLVELVNSINDADRYLVMSLTTKSEDLIDIITTYSKNIDFKLILTKIDETETLGSIVNICFMTGKKISYITNGQSVPHDIRKLEPEFVAKSILGFGGEY